MFEAVLGFRLEVWGPGFEASGLDLGLRVSGFRFRCAGFRFQGLGFGKNASILTFGWRKFSNVFAEDGGGGCLSEVEIDKGKQVDHKSPLSRL